MKKTRLFKRGLCLLLSLVMVAGYLPSIHAHAAENAEEQDKSTSSNVSGGLEGQEADIFTALGFDTTVKPEGYDAETTDNPYGRDRLAGDQIFEIVVSSNSGTKNAGDGDNSLNVSDVVNGGLGGSASPLLVSNSAAGDFDGDGLPGEIVYVGMEPISLASGDFTSKSLKMLTYDGKTGVYNPGKTIATINMGTFEANDLYYGGADFRLHRNMRSELNDIELVGKMEVTAGDFDGDGYAEIAVYVPQSGNARVDVYKWMRDKESAKDDWKDWNNWSVVWTHALSNSSVVPNMVSLLSADINRDGVDDLGIAFSGITRNVSQWGASWSINTNSTAKILFGSRTNMLQSSAALNLQEGELGKQIRTSLTVGDLDGDGYDDLIATGQPASNFQANTTRSVVVYTYNGAGGLAVLYKGNHKVVDGEYSTSESTNEDGETVTTTSWVSNNGFDDVYLSSPYVRTNAAVVKLSGYDYRHLYLDSCLYEYVDGTLTLKIALDDPSYDGSNTLGTTWLSNRPYLEYGAAAADINGPNAATPGASGNQQLYVSFLLRDGYSGYYTLYPLDDPNTEENELTVYNDPSKTEIDVDHEGGFGGLQGNGSGGLTAAVKVNKDEQFVMNGDTILDAPAVKPGAMTVTAADVDMDTTLIVYSGIHNLSYSDPKVLAIIAAAPYFKDVDVICDYDYAWQNTTSFSDTKGEGEGSLVGVDLEAGAYIAHSSNSFGFMTEMETSVNFTLEWEKEISTTTEYTVTYETSQEEDSVVMYSVPTENYLYYIYTPDGKGGYNEPEVQNISRAFQPVNQVVTLEYYESIREDYGDAMPPIKGVALKSSPGDPGSYPKSAAGYDVISQWKYDPAGISFGNGAITQEISITKEEAESYNFGCALDFKLGAGAHVEAGLGFAKVEHDITGGIQFSLNPTGGFTTLNLTGTTISGTVTNMPLEFQDYGYYYNWKLFSYKYNVGGNSIPVVSYIVNDVSEPPRLPEDFQQDYDRTTSDKNVLTWTYDGEYSSFIIYKYYDFPVGGGLQEIARFEKGETPFVLKYDENGTPYREYYFEDLNLAPYTQYQYAIQVERLSKIPPLSAPSGLMSARTKAADGNPVSIIVESDGKNDGLLMVYPDKNSYMTATVTGPNGESSDEYYTTTQYQWQKKVDGAWTDLENETNKTLTIASAGSEVTGEYRCRINVLTSTDATAITAYTDSVSLQHSKRSTYFKDVYVREVKGGIELHAQVINAHSDSGAVPSGKVNFTLTHVQTGRNYWYYGELDGTGTFVEIAETTLPAGTYNVTVLYNGSTVFKTCEAECVFLSRLSKGYTIDSPESVTYGDGTTIIFNEVSTINGYSVLTPVDAASLGLYKTYSQSAKQEYTKDSVFSIEGKLVYSGDKIVAGEQYSIYTGVKWVFTGGMPEWRYYYVTFTAEISGQYISYSSSPYQVTLIPETAEDCIVKGEEPGTYTLKDNTGVGEYIIMATTPDGGTVKQKFSITPRDISLKLLELQRKQDSSAKMGDITYSQLEVTDGSWAPCDCDEAGNITGTIASTSVNPTYTNTAGTTYNKNSSLSQCGYYIITAKDNLDNYNVTFTAGSMSIVGGTKPMTMGVRPFEGEDVGTLYLVSPDYAFTREEKAVTMSQAVGSRLVFNAVPDEGYQVYDWYVNGEPQGVTASSFAYVMLNQDVTVEVQFVFKPDTLVFGITGETDGGTLTCSDASLTSGSIVIPNTYLTYTAQAREGYHFKEWRYTELGKGTAYYTQGSGGSKATFNLLMPKSSCSLYAVFERDGYTLTFTDKTGANGLTAWYWGSVTGDTTAELEKITVESGDVVPGDTEIVIQAKQGYELNADYNFVATGSQGKADYEKGTYTLILTEDTEVTGYTTQNFFDVNVEFNIAKTYTFCKDAKITVTIDGTEYPHECPEDSKSYSISGISGGSKVSVSVSYPDYYIFEGWDVNGTVKMAETYTVAELGENTTFTLNLTEKPVYKVTLADISDKGSYTVTLPAGAGQEGNVVTCHENDALTIRVTPESGYTVTYWNVKAADDENSWETKASSLKYQFPTLTADYTFTPEFSGTTYLTVTWPTLRYYGVTLTAEEGYLTTVNSGGDFKFTLSGGESEYEYVLVNGRRFYSTSEMGNHWPYRYETVNGVRVYTIQNITANQEVSVSKTEPSYSMSVSPNPADVIAGKTVTLTATATGIDPALYKWYEHGENYSTTIHQESASNVFTYQAPLTPGETRTVYVASVLFDNGRTDNDVVGNVKINILDAVKSIDITSDDLTASADGSFLIYPITPTGDIGTYDFNANVTMLSGKTNADVTWTLWGAQMRGTFIDENGVLTVSDKEYGTNGQLKITATYHYSNGDTDKQEIVINLCPDAYVACEVVNNIHGTVGESGYVAGGKTVTITAKPHENHAVARWFINGVAVSNDTSETMTLTVEEMTHYKVSVEFTHYYPDAKNDEHDHWYECSCGDRTEVEEHYDFDKNHNCDKCDYVMSVCADDDKNHFCDWCGTQMTECADELQDHICDWCGDVLTVCVDEDLDHICDWCDIIISQCEDANNNHFCDHCKKTLTECVDNSLDHNCDICGRELTTCGDNDSDHLCDICGERLTECADDDHDHSCDICGVTTSECKDDNKDHNCDFCGKEDLTECTDADPKDHVCDICGEKMTECTDEDKDHQCDDCGGKLSECADEDKNHLCDVCNKELTTCADEDKDHLCDVCGKTLSQCADDDSDHFCDVCGKQLTPCVDEDPADNICDICGKELSAHTCADENSDHLCDVCGKALTECADDNSDHLCDVCGETLTVCGDSDNDHKCDLCGKPLSECADEDKNHKCDLCGETVSECTDEDKDHKCDTCGTKLGECADSDRDHKCDTCGTVLSTCGDADNDHACDTCGTALTSCADNDQNHNCDVCGETLTVCGDSDNDHKCDLCGKTLSECVDEDKNHKCDICGTEVSQCADEDSDHKCDTCGKTLTQCVDADPADNICDVCGKDMHECADDNKDHACDHCGYILTVCVDEDKNHACDICGETNSLCADNDKDHNCDICGKTLTECSDEDDHKCDICGKTLSECVDADHNDKCDICGAKTNIHADGDNNHRCDVCDKPLSECNDADNDHLCDLCGIVWTVCVDKNQDHVCDICGGSVGIHANIEGSHICEYCGKAIDTCDDPDMDHFCDVCGKELSSCADKDNDHLCDVCSKELSVCLDEDNDHLCDICGKQLTECIDEDDDEQCDICDETMVYANVVIQNDGGTVTVDKETAAKDEIVTVTVEVGAGKSLIAITGTMEDGKAVHLTDNGDGTYTFIQPGEDVTIEATYNNELFSISFASMTMANSLDMNFAFKQAYRDDWSGYYAKIEKEYENAENVIQYIFFEDWKTTTISGEAYYYVTFTGIAAKEMTDTLYVTIHNADGQAVSSVWEDSVQAQAMRNLAKEDVTELAQTMVVDMLNYGTAAQNRFEYNVGNLANSKLTDEQKAFATVSVSYVDTSVHGDNYRANVYLLSNIQFMMAFTNVDQTMNAVVSFTDHYGRAKEITIPGSEFEKNGGYHVLIIEQTVIADAHQNINCKIYDANGKLVTEVTDSMASYSARAKQNTGNDLYEMIMKFATSAYAYLHNK